MSCVFVGSLGHPPFDRSASVEGRNRVIGTVCLIYARFPLLWAVVVLVLNWSARSSMHAWRQLFRFINNCMHAAVFDCRPEGFSRHRLHDLLYMHRPRSTTVTEDLICNNPAGQTCMELASYRTGLSSCSTSWFSNIMVIRHICSTTHTWFSSTCALPACISEQCSFPNYSSPTD